MASAPDARPDTHNSAPSPTGVPVLPPDATPEQKDAHWFAHVYQGDRMPQLTFRAVAMGAVLGASASTQDLTQPVLDLTFNLPNSRTDEQEADRIGIQVLARSGFDPRAMADFFERLQTVNRYNDPAAIPEYLRTHPVTINRIAEARSLAARYPPVRLSAEREFHLSRARTQAYAADRPEEALAMFESSLREGKYADELAARYGYTIALMRTGDYERARVQAERLMREHPKRVEFGLERMEIERRAGRREVAWQLVEDLTGRFPDDRTIAMEKADLALETQRFEVARDLLRDYAYRFPVDARYYRMLAQAEGRSGSKVESHIALAEYYHKLGDLRRGIEQLRLARSEGGVDTYQRSRIEARSQELEVLMAEQLERGEVERVVRRDPGREQRAEDADEGRDRGDDAPTRQVLPFCRCVLCVIHRTCVF